MLYELATIPETPSPELQAVLSWIDGFNRWDFDHVKAATTDNCMHHVLPKSLGIPPKTKAEYIASMAGATPPLNGFTVAIYDIIEGPGKVSLHASSSATSTTGCPYTNEYNLTFHTAPQADGRHKITLVKEFVDSKYSMEFFLAERERQEQQLAAKKKAEEAAQAAASVSGAAAQKIAVVPPMKTAIAV